MFVTGWFFAHTTIMLEFYIYISKESTETNIFSCKVVCWRDMHFTYYPGLPFCSSFKHWLQKKPCSIEIWLEHFVFLTPFMFFCKLPKNLCNVIWSDLLKAGVKTQKNVMQSSIETQKSLDIFLLIFWTFVNFYVGIFLFLFGFGWEQRHDRKATISFEFMCV